MAASSKRRDYVESGFPIPNINKTAPSKKPCRTCTDFKSWMAMHGKQLPESNQENRQCPLDRDELGRNTWSFLHTMAAYYPEKPSLSTQKEMTKFIGLFSKFYPCEDCAADMRADLETDKPRTASRYDLQQWFCRLHNKVNVKLGKPEFDCSKVSERWLDGWKDGSCG